MKSKGIYFIKKSDLSGILNPYLTLTLGWLKKYVIKNK